MERNFRKEWERGENGVMFTDQQSVVWMNDLLDELDRKDKELTEKIESENTSIKRLRKENDAWRGAYFKLIDETSDKDKIIEYLHDSIRVLVEDDDEDEWIDIVNEKDKEIEALKEELQSVLRDWRAEQEMDQIGGSAKRYYADPTEEVWGGYEEDKEPDVKQDSKGWTEEVFLTWEEIFGDDVETSYEKEIKRQKEEEEPQSKTFVLSDKELADVIEKSENMDHEAILENLPRTKKKIEDIHKERKAK